jgi:hypothetical protein
MLINTAGVFYVAGIAYPSQAPEFTPGDFGGVRVAHIFSFMCCPIMCLYILTMFCSSLPLVVCRRAHISFTLFVFVCV